MRNLELPVLLLLLLGLAACGTSAVDRNTTAASISRIGIDATAGGIEVACEDPQSEDALHRCLRAVETHEALRAAWDVWAAAILLAASEEDENAIEMMLRMSGPVFELYEEVSEMLRQFGVDVPALPGMEQ